MHGNVIAAHFAYDGSVRQPAHRRLKPYCALQVNAAHYRQVNTQTDKH